ncbi:hypothetical protein ACFLYB_00485 [Chloroflexota bacterium]
MVELRFKLSVNEEQVAERKCISSSDVLTTNYQLCIMNNVSTAEVRYRAFSFHSPHILAVKPFPGNWQISLN